MFDRVESYHRPRSLAEALRLLRAGGTVARVVAGGTDVIVECDPAIRSLVDINGLGLSYIKRKGNSLALGATTTMAAIEDSPETRALAGGILAQAASTCGSVQVRHSATLGGNLAHASPAADTAPPLLVLDAAVVFAGPTGRRRKVPLGEFFLGPGKNVLGRALLVEVLVPIPGARGRVGWSFQKLGRTETDISLVSVSAGLAIDPKGAVKWARLALGAVAPTPMRALGAEKLLAGRKLAGSLLREACDLAAGEISPVSDVRASADYRREASRVLARRALEACAESAGGAL